MPKFSKGQVEQMAEELLALRGIYERYQQLEKQLKASMAALEIAEFDLPSGRLFISTSETATVSPAAARSVLGEERAAKVIKRRESVVNRLLEAFVEAGEISEQEWVDLLARAETRSVVRLHVRPLK